MLVDSLKLPRNLLADVKVEILRHDANLLGPSYWQLIVREILYGFTEKICAIDPGDQRLSLVTELHRSLYRVPLLIRREDSHR